MITGDAQVGTPGVLYKDTKANIEALTGLAEGAQAYATDTNQFGTFDGSAWTWGQNVGASAGGAGQVVEIARWAAASLQTNFDLPDTAESLLIVGDQGSIVDPLIYSLSSDRTQLVFDSGITAGHIVTAEYVIAQV